MIKENENNNEESGGERIVLEKGRDL